MQRPHLYFHRSHITPLCRKHSCNERQVISPRLSLHVAHQIADDTWMDFRPIATWITTRSWSTENFWRDFSFKIVPGVWIIIFFLRHATPPLLSCTENSGRVRHRTVVPWGQQMGLPLACVRCCKSSRISALCCCSK